MSMMSWARCFSSYIITSFPYFPISLRQVYFVSSCSIWMIMSFILIYPTMFVEGFCSAICVLLAV